MASWTVRYTRVHKAQLLANSDGLARLPIEICSRWKALTGDIKENSLTPIPLDLLNNAGYALYTPLMDADIQQSKKQYDVNVWGVLAMTQAFFPMLRAAKGMVVNQGSVSGLQNNNLPYSGVYASSKAAVYSMSAVMRVELAPFDIKVVTLVTSAVQTGFFANKVGGSISKSSAYHPIKAEAENAMSGSSAMGRARDRYEVAEATIAELLQPTPPLFIRKGYYPNVFVWMYWLLPIWVLDMLSRKFGKMDRLAQLLAGADSGKKIN